MNRKTALVLGGGGSRGSYEMGVWQALREMGTEIDIVTGTSIGAINGAMVVQGEYEAAAALWNTIETAQVIDIPVKETDMLKQKVLQTYQSFAINFVKDGGTDTAPLKRTLQTVVNEDKIRSSVMDYGLVTIEMDTGIPHELFKEDIPNGKMIDYIVASASIYPAFQPHEIDKVRYLDGAYYDNLPVKMALEKGATDIIAVDLGAFGVVKKEVLALADRATYIRSYWNLGPTLVFDFSTMQHNMRLGYLDALKAFHAYEGCAFTFIHGFCKEAAGLFTKLLPLEALLEKGSGGFVLDQLFLAQLTKIYEDHGISEPGNEEIALVCAEAAGEIFGMDNEIIYSFEIWQKQLQKRVSEAMLTVPEAKGPVNLLGMLAENAKMLSSRQLRAIAAAQLITETLETPDYQPSAASLTVLPEAFLAGTYLAAAIPDCPCKY